MDVGLEPAGRLDGRSVPADRKGLGLTFRRASRPDELEILRPLAHEFHAESRYSHIPFSDAKLDASYLRAIERPGDVLLAYALNKGTAIGMVHAVVGDYHLGEGGRMATLHGFYTSAEIRHSLLGGKVSMRLLRIASDWAAAGKAEELHIWSNSGVAVHRVDRLLDKLGFSTYGGSYVARLTRP